MQLIPYFPISVGENPTETNRSYFRKLNKCNLKRYTGPLRHLVNNPMQLTS